MTKMIDEQLARLRAHRNNIARYRRLQQTHLTDHERGYIEQRIAEERSKFDHLAAELFPIAFADPDVPVLTLGATPVVDVQRERI
jgi:hypothetical protein